MNDSQEYYEYTDEEERLFIDSYLIALLWSTRDESVGDEGDDCLDASYSLSHIDCASYEQAKADCLDFIFMAKELLIVGTPEQMGHDFSLCRNRHGADFRDRNYNKKVANALVEIAQGFKETSAWAECGTVYIEVPQ